MANPLTKVKKLDVSGNTQWCVYRQGADKKPTGDSLGCFQDAPKADEKIAALYEAEGKSISLEEIKSAKYWDDGPSGYTYVPWGVTSLKDALAAQDAQEDAQEIQALGQMYNQIVNNILGSPDISDKASAITSLADEFAAELKSEVAADNESDDNGGNGVADQELNGMGGDLSEKSIKTNSGFLVTDKDGNGHLPTRKDGKIDHGLMGGAWAALHGGYRGNVYSGPDKDKAIAKLKKLYKEEGMDTPKSAAEYLAIKSLPGNRVGSYAVLWGTEDRKDLTEEYFDQSTEELTSVFDAVGRLPFIYHHGLDEEVKTKVIGVVDTLKPDSIGLWYEAQLKIADEYDTYIKQMFDDKRLKTSSQTFAVARRVNQKSGHIERWPIVEITATPAPAEHRMPAIEILKSAYDEIGSDFGEILKRYSEEKTQGAEKARANLAIQRLRFAQL